MLTNLNNNISNNSNNNNKDKTNRVVFTVPKQTNTTNMNTNYIMMVIHDILNKSKYNTNNNTNNNNNN